MNKDRKRKADISMDDALCEDYFKEKESVKRAATLAAILFFLLMGITSSGDAIAASTQKTGSEESVQTSPAAGGGEAWSAADKGAVAARVNGVDIPMQSLITMMRRIMAKKDPGDTAQEDMEKVKKTALNRLVLQELALQKARALGMKVEKKEIDEVITNARTKMGGEEAYRSYIEKEGLSETELREQIERALILERISKSVLNEKTTISEDELKREYEKNKAKYLMPEKIMVIDVVLFMIAGDKDSEKKAGVILSKIRNDPDMNPKNLEPDGTFIVREYELKKDKQKELYEAARKLSEGELSGIITTPDSLHIIKIMQYSPETQLSFERVRGYIEGQLLAIARQKKLHEWEAEMKKDAKIEILEIKESEKKEDDSKK